MRTLLSAMALSILVSGCSSLIMANYVGQPLTAPILDYGPPAAAFDMGDGQRAFVWSMRESGVIPGHTSTNASLLAQTSYSGNTATTAANIYANSVSMPPMAYSYDCNYTLLARQTRTDVDGPSAWEITGYRKPSLKCE